MSRLVHTLVSPLGTALLAGLLALLLARRSRRASFALGAFALFWAWLWATPVASDALRGWLEDRAGPRDIAEVRPAPVIVVLGGAVSGPKPPRRPDPDLGAAADRVWHAVRLQQAGKAPRILLSGGALRPDERPEAESMQRFAQALGVPAGALLREESSVNTSGNARATARLLAGDGVREIILVTSALHMQRARGLFEREGLSVIPAPTDWEVVTMPFEPERLLPDGDALEGSGRAFKEIIGRLVGR